MKITPKQALKVMDTRDLTPQEFKYLEEQGWMNGEILDKAQKRSLQRAKDAGITNEDIARVIAEKGLNPSAMGRLAPLLNNPAKRDSEANTKVKSQLSQAEMDYVPSPEELVPPSEPTFPKPKPKTDDRKPVDFGEYAWHPLPNDDGWYIRHDEKDAANAAAARAKNDAGEYDGMSGEDKAVKPLNVDPPSFMMPSKQKVGSDFNTSFMDSIEREQREDEVGAAFQRQGNEQMLGALFDQSGYSSTTGVQDDNFEFPEPMMSEPVIADETGTFGSKSDEDNAKTGYTSGSNVVITDDGKAVETTEEWWESPARGMAQGLRDFGLELLRTGDYGKASAKGIEKAFGDLDHEVARKKEERERAKLFDAYAKDGRANPSLRNNYIKTGDSSFLHYKPNYSISGDREKGQTVFNTNTGEYQHINPTFIGDKQKEANKALVTSARKAVSTSDSVIDLLDTISNEEIERLTGFDTNFTPSLTSLAREGESKFARLGGMGFLQEISAMKGMGALSDAEGGKIMTSYSALIDPQTQTLKSGLSPEFVRTEIKRLRQAANNLKIINQYVEKTGKEPSLEEQKALGLTLGSPSKQEYEIGTRRMTKDGREVMFDGKGWVLV